MNDLLVIGAGNPDIVRLIEDINLEKSKFNFLGFLEKNKTLHNTEFCGYPILGDDTMLDNKNFSKILLINNVYKNQAVRKVTTEKLNKYNNRFCNLIHPSSHIRNINMGIGNIVGDNVIIQSGVKIGNHNIIHSASVISHETIIGNNCLISVNVAIGSRNKIGNFCFFGISSCSFPNVIIEDFAFIGGGAAVANNIKKNKTVFGNPARILPKI